VCHSGRSGGCYEHSAVWQWHMLKPMLLLIVVLLPVFAQMGTRYQWRPLQGTGEETIIRVECRKSRPPGQRVEATLGAV
jgi:hypothetical protein